MRPAPESVLSVAARVDARLAAVLQSEVERWVAFDADLAAPFGELQRLVLAGGKRLRPAFTYWGFVGAGGSPEAGTVIDAGAAFELMHAFALFHDDIMDGSTARRGQPTTHEVHRQLHEDHRWAGDARRFGDGVAILVGDLAFVYADVLLAGAPRAAWDLWNELRIELNVGQYLDMLGSAHSERRREKAERICRYKSGKYTIERPLHLGALLAGGSTDLLAAYSEYGLPLGDAFQMRDDVLGAFGESAVTGKPVGDDLREGKPTPLMAIAVARATAAQQQVLAQVGAALLDDAQVATVQQVIVDTGALAELEATITRLTDEAVAAISTAPVSSQGRDELIHRHQL
ncbi:MAG: polyprenyl synthetase family protein [Actinobacteria bacterium]|nr:polyprenyl synthetase family protein [Actinomycetota bacterium]